MIIIVEGVDRVGKTTLCNKLHEELGFEIFHDEYKPKYISPDYIPYTPVVNEIVNMKFNILLQFIKKFDNIIIDRCHLTEYAYDYQRGVIYHGFSEIDEQLSKLDTYLVMVASEDIKKSSEEHGCDLRVTEMIFKSLFYSSKIKEKFVVKYSKFDEIINDMKLIALLNAIGLGKVEML